ncbi:phage baseplate protein [Yersinia enterocolitica]
MAITGLFTRNRPKIGNLYFDALLEESSELRTDVSEFPLEDANTAHDNAVTRALALTMIIGVSDNWFRELLAQQDSSIAGLLGAGASITTGMAASLLSGRAAALAGVAASVGTSLYSGSLGSPSRSTRSQNLLEQLRELQRSHTPFELVASRGAAYKNCLITNTRTQLKKENEGGLELWLNCCSSILFTTPLLKPMTTYPMAIVPPLRGNVNTHLAKFLSRPRNESYPIK